MLSLGHTYVLCRYCLKAFLYPTNTRRGSDWNYVPWKPGQGLASSRANASGRMNEGLASRLSALLFGTLTGRRPHQRLWLDCMYLEHARGPYGLSCHYTQDMSWSYTQALGPFPVLWRGLFVHPRQFLELESGACHAAINLSSSEFHPPPPMVPVK